MCPGSNIAERIKSDGRCYVEWYIGGTRRRASAGVTTAQTLEAQRRSAMNWKAANSACPALKRLAKRQQPLHVAITKYLEQTP